MEFDMKEIQDWKENGLTWREIGLKLSERYGGDPYHWSERARKRTYRRRAKKNLTNGDKTSEISEPFTLINEDDLNNTDSLLRLHGYDPEEWSVVDSSCIIRKNTINTRVKVKPSTIPKINIEKLSSAIQDALDNIDIEERTYQPTNDDTLFVNMFDLHYGRKYRDKNHINTTEDVLSAIDNIVNHYKNNKPARIEFPVGQDIFNTDNAFNTTTKGTPQTNSLEWYEMYANGVALVVKIIEKLSVLAPITIRHSKGNHSAVTSYALVLTLAMKYEHCSYVDVKTTFDYRQYIELDNVLVGVSHGNEEKNLSKLMQTEAREAWGRCKHHIWFTGHEHHYEAYEKDGVIIMKCPALAFIDDFHDIKGYTSANRALACVRLNKEGLKEIYFGYPTCR